MLEPWIDINATPHYHDLMRLLGQEPARRIVMRMPWKAAFRTAFVIAVMMIGLSKAHAAEMTVMAANAVKRPLLELVSAFERSSGHKITLSWGGTEGIAKKVNDGATVDVVIIAAANIDKLSSDGKLVAGSRADFAKIGIGIAVRAGLPRPDISSSEAVKSAVLAARSVAYSSGPSGFYIADLFKKMGIADQIRDKVRQPASGVQVAELVAHGEADLGFQQVSELVGVKGIDYLGPLPADIQNVTTYSAGLHTTSRAPEAAKALVKFLTAPEAGPIIKKSGMEPG